MRRSSVKLLGLKKSATKMVIGCEQQKLLYFKYKTKKTFSKIWDSVHVPVDNS